MATILQCKFCSKPFQSMGGKVCESCLDQIDLDYITIRDYIYDNPGAVDLDAISEGTGVRKKILLYLIEEQRLILKQPEGKSYFSCSVCRKPIEKGSMCDSCRDSIAAQLSSALPKIEDKKPILKPTGVKMHTKAADDKQKK